MSTHRSCFSVPGDEAQPRRLRSLRPKSFEERTRASQEKPFEYSRAKTDLSWNENCLSKTFAKVELSGNEFLRHLILIFQAELETRFRRKSDKLSEIDINAWYLVASAFDAL